MSAGGDSTGLSQIEEDLVLTPAISLAAAV
jgi:hypothetical protein